MSLSLDQKLKNAEQEIERLKNVIRDIEYRYPECKSKSGWSNPKE